MNLTVFQRVGEIVFSSHARKTQEHVEFLTFYRTLVETIDGDVAKAIGKTVITVNVPWTGKEENWSIELTVADYLFWKEKIAIGVRFKYAIDAVKAAILGSMTKAGENNKFTAAERKEILGLLEGTA